MVRDYLWYPLLQKRKKPAEDKVIDCPIRQKLLKALPRVRKKFLKDPAVTQRANVNHLDNFVLCYKRGGINDLMEIILDDLLAVPTSAANKDWWDSGFPATENVSSQTREHLEMEKLAVEMLKSIYHEIKGKNNA